MQTQSGGEKAELQELWQTGARIRWQLACVSSSATIQTYDISQGEASRKTSTYFLLFTNEKTLVVQTKPKTFCGGAPNRRFS